MSKNCYVMGVDFGTDSARAVVADPQNGSILSSAACEYPRWKDRKYCDGTTGMFRQHPKDYVEAMENCVTSAIQKAGKDADKKITAIGFDTTGSTPCPIDRKGVPLALLPGYEEDPNLMFYLWKDHTAQKEAEELNHVLENYHGTDYTKYQGTYSAEWYWSKILHGVRSNPEIRQNAYMWVEHADWMPSLLSGRTKPDSLYHCCCAAGHKALWHSEFGGLPAEEAFDSIDVYLGDIRRRYGRDPEYSTACVGTITNAWAKRLGLNPETIIAGSSLDAHAGAVGSGIRKNTLVKVIGTSAVDMLIQDAEITRGKNLKKICGQAENSILPGAVGIEASQAAFGDVYSWYRNILMQPLQAFLAETGRKQKESNQFLEEFKTFLLPYLDNCLEKHSSESNVTAVDWFNGRRYPDLNESVSAGLYGVTLGTTAEQIYKALVLATVFGAKRVFESFIAHGLQIDEIVAAGGVSRKSSFVMQMLADAFGRPIKVTSETQTCALGAAMYAMVAAGICKDLSSAQRSMLKKFDRIYSPTREREEELQLAYKKYLLLGEKFEDIQQADRTINIV